MKDKEFLEKAIEASRQAFACDAIIIIPYWQDKEASPAEVEVPVLYSQLTPESVDNLLSHAGKIADMNIAARAHAAANVLPTDLTPTFNRQDHPTA